MAPLLRALALAAALAAAACGGGRARYTPLSEDAGPDGDADAAPLPATAVDILFVVDDSDGMLEEQAILAEQAEVLLRELIDPTPDPETGLSPPPVEDLHVGVLTSNMGTAGFQPGWCSNPSLGDDGMLQATGRHEGCEPTYSAPGCEREDCPWLVRSEDEPNDGSVAGDAPLWDDFACVALLGAGSCAWVVQPLESLLTAVTTQASPGRPNEGFLRDDSVVLVVIVTNGDDCSASDPAMFDPTREDLGPMNLRCAMRDDMLHPVGRYRDALLALRPGHADRVLVAVIAGVPLDGSWSPGDPLDELRALVQVDPLDENQLLPLCESDELGVAYAPVRLAELACSFGPSGLLASICQTDWTEAFEAMARLVQRRLGEGS